jgi:hypothetical protein
MMGRALAIYILHCGDDSRHDPANTAKNILQSGIDIRIEVVPSAVHNLNELVPDTFWKMFIYSDEWFSKNLVKALPSYLEQNIFNVISIYRLAENDTKEPKISVSPRLFVSNISLKNWSLEPASVHDNIRKIVHTTILDGFIFGKIA